MSVRSASRGSPAAKSIRLALRTSSIVATRRASFVRWVLRCFGRRRLSSSPKLPPISFMPSMMRFQVPPRADSLNHKPIRHVNNLLLILIDGKEHPVYFLSSQEILQMSDDEIIVFYGDFPPFRAKRMDWRRFPVLTQRCNLIPPALPPLPVLEEPQLATDPPQPHPAVFTYISPNGL